MAYLAAAMTLPGGQTVNAPNGVPTGGVDFLGGVLRNGLTYFLIAAVILCLINIVWSGVKWASSSGDKAKVAQARSRMTWAIIGLVIVFSVFFILNIIGYFFNVNIGT